MINSFVTDQITMKMGLFSNCFIGMFDILEDLLIEKESNEIKKSQFNNKCDDIVQINLSFISVGLCYNKTCSYILKLREKTE